MVGAAESANAERALMKRRAASALRQAGRDHLAELGLRQRSSSPRQWIGDHGWWLVNVEFQASRYSVGSYLNVGLQYLWTVVDFRTFGHSPVRFAIPGCGQFASLEGSESEVRRNADAVGCAARAAAAELTVHSLGSDDAHLRWLSQRAATDFWAQLDVMVASGLLAGSSTVSAAFAALAVGLDRSIGWQDKAAVDLKLFAELVRTKELFRAEINNRISETRGRLKLPTMDLYI